MLRTARTVVAATLAWVNAQTPVEASQTCQPVDFQSHDGIFRVTNGAIDLTNHISKWILVFKDPVMVPTKMLGTVPFSAFWSSFDIKPTVNNASVAGFSKLQLHHVDAIDHTVLSAGLQVNEELRLKASVNVNVVQKDRSWYSFCWTDFWHPWRCNPIDSTLEVDFGVVDASGDVAVIIELLECAKNQAASSCSDMTTGDLLKSAITFKMDKLFDRFLLRMQRLALQSVIVSFTKITALDAHLSDQSWLLSKIQKAIAAYSMEELNRHGAVYQTFHSFAMNIIRELVNHAIERTITPRFGKTCIDQA